MARDYHHQISEQDQFDLVPLLFEAAIEGIYVAGPVDDQTEMIDQQAFIKLYSDSGSPLTDDEIAMPHAISR